MFPLKIHIWQQTRATTNSRLEKLALLDGFYQSCPPFRNEALSANWRSDVRQFTDTHGQQTVLDELDTANVVEQEQARSGSVEDEHHFLFDCPALQSQCSDYSKLFGTLPPQ